MKVVENTCNIENRPIIEAQLLSVTSMPVGSGTDFAVHNSKIYFLSTDASTGLTYYNIYDLSTQTWSKSSDYRITGRQYGATILVAANKIFYAGGVKNDQSYLLEVSEDVNIYDITTNSWSTTKLSAGGYDVAGAVVGNTVLFAGGLRYDLNNNIGPSRIVDKYNLLTNTWSTASLRQPRADITTVTSQGKVYFAGGSTGANPSGGILGATNLIDIYDDASGTWSASALSEPKARMTGIAVGDKIFWAGGLNLLDEWTRYVEIRDVSNQNYTRACLVHEKYWLHNNSGAALINQNQIVFFTGIPTSSFGYNTRFDLYDVNTNTWSVGKLPFDIGGASIFSHNNTVYVVGGWVNGSASTRIWKLAF